MNILCVKGLDGPCFELLISRPMHLLMQTRDIRFKAVYTFDLLPEDVLEADVVFFQRNSEDADRQLFQICKELGKPTIFFIDDDLLHVPEGLGTSSAYHNVPHRKANILFFLQEADVIVAGTDALAAILARYSSRPIVVFPQGNPEEYYAPVSHSTDGVVRFAVVLASGHSLAYANVVAPAIRRVLAAYGDRAEFIIFGNPLAGVTDGWANVRHIGKMPMEEYVPVFSRTVADAALAYLDDSPFTRCKTSLKFREFSARGLAGIYSNMPVYASCVENGVTGFLAEDTEDAWFDLMSVCIKYPKKTKAVGLAARAYAESHYRITPYVEALWETVARIAETKTGGSTGE